MGEVIRIRCVHDSIIGRRDHSLGWVIDARQVAERDVASPIVVLDPAV